MRDLKMNEYFYISIFENQRTFPTFLADFCILCTIFLDGFRHIAQNIFFRTFHIETKNPLFTANNE